MLEEIFFCIPGYFKRAPKLAHDRQGPWQFVLRRPCQERQARGQRDLVVNIAVNPEFHHTLRGNHVADVRLDGQLRIRTAAISAQ